MRKLNGNPVTTVLTISTGFIIIFLVTSWEWPIWVSLFIGLAGVLSAWLSKIIHLLWMKLAYVLSLIIPNILLSAVFYILLLPLSVLSKIFRERDYLILKDNVQSTFLDVNKSFEKEVFEKPW